MTTVHTVEVEVGGRTITLETGKLAKQANGAVLLRCEDTVVLVTAVAREEMRENQDFFPLTVDVEERMYAAGKIPGGFIKRESRPSDKATLTARQIDRPIRPSFPQGFMNEVQIIGTVLSYDQENAYDVLTMTGASAALTISEIPFLGPLGAVRVGLIDGEYVVNPLLSQLDEATLDLVVSGSRDAIVMVEAGANEATEEQVLEGLRIAHREIQKLIDAQLRLAELAGKPKWEVPAYEVDRGLYDEIVRSYGAEVDRVTAIADKKACHDATRSPCASA
jgi:polyribonucleotide nucleotidyltransferase